TDMKRVEVRLYLDNIPKKSFTTLWNPLDIEYSDIKKKAASWFDLNDGVDYDKVELIIINEVKTNTEMPRTKAIKTDEIEEAEVIEETAETNALTIAEKISQNLPTIPDVFIIDGQE